MAKVKHTSSWKALSTGTSSSAETECSGDWICMDAQNHVYSGFRKARLLEWTALIDMIVDIDFLADPSAGPKPFDDQFGEGDLSRRRKPLTPEEESVFAAAEEKSRSR